MYVLRSEPERVIVPSSPSNIALGELFGVESGVVMPFKFGLRKFFDGGAGPWGSLSRSRMMKDGVFGVSMSATVLMTMILVCCARWNVIRSLIKV